MSAPQPQPPIPHDHPLRAFYEQQRQAALMDQQAACERVQAFNRALGYGDGSARDRRRMARQGQGDGDGKYKAAS